MLPLQGAPGSIPGGETKANEHVKDRDEKKDQLSPQFEKGLDAILTR